MYATTLGLRFLELPFSIRPGTGISPQKGIGCAGLLRRSLKSIRTGLVLKSVTTSIKVVLSYVISKCRTVWLFSHFCLYQGAETLVKQVIITIRLHAMMPYHLILGMPTPSALLRCRYDFMRL